MTTSRVASVLALALAVAGCGREGWPDPPPVDQGKYQADYDAWRRERQETAMFALSIVGIWPVQEGETPFGSDPALPIVLPAAAGSARAGVFTRVGDTVTVIPAPGSSLQVDGDPARGPAPVETFETVLALGSVRLQVIEMGEESPKRLFVTGGDENHPSVKSPTPIEAYTLDRQWRVAARFDAFDAPKPVTVPDVRGGSMPFLAIGQLVFRLKEQEHRLTAFGEAGGDVFFVMFKDPTNQTATYGGYRILTPAAVKGGEWAVLDFNLALNPPCAYSSFTTCPLPPPENRLTVAVEAGEKRHPLGAP